MWSQLQGTAPLRRKYIFSVNQDDAAASLDAAIVIYLMIIAPTIIHQFGFTVRCKLLPLLYVSDV